MTTAATIMIHPDDSVCIPLRPLAKGEQLNLGDNSVTLQEDIPQGHKIARKRILSGEHVLKFGYSIGKASSDIQAGLALKKSRSLKME